ncbi:Histidine kinase [Marivirga sericea]|uniref:Histidine kinase n=1 Tax=Marivirga sericea TaxID=1028 RepID=A0A1X7I819_9BACT|nr:histidine kinase [Marivirga sericea]SMG10690.1 Histidine kinase [Marivirga sericea]
MILKRLTQYKIHHLIGWLLYFSIAAAGYNRFYENKLDLLLVTSVYVFSHALMYYISQYVLTAFSFKKGRPWLFFIGYVLLAIFLSFVMYGVIYLILGDQMPLYFGKEFLTVFSVFLISNLFMGGVLIGIKSMIDKSRQQKFEKERKQESLLSELSYLKAQVNPHFLFNTINSVYVLIKMNPDKAADMLIKLSDLLRSQLYDFSSDKITIEEEINYLENYIELEKLRRAHRLEVHFEKEGLLQGFSLPPLLMIPFLENCFKHLSSDTDKSNIVRIRMTRNFSKLSVEFSNTFDKQSAPRKEGGIGLPNVKRRLALLFPDKYQLEINRTDELFRVNLELDLSDYE